MMGNGDGLLDFRKRTKIWELSAQLLNLLEVRKGMERKARLIVKY